MIRCTSPFFFFFVVLSFVVGFCPRSSAEIIDQRNFAIDTYYPTPNEIRLAVLRKIEYWHQGSIAAFKIMCRDGKGFWHRVHWDGKTASVSALQETDERKASMKLFTED